MQNIQLNNICVYDGIYKNALEYYVSKKYIFIHMKILLVVVIKYKCICFQNPVVVSI